jgi:hypothetical protein
MLISYNSMQKEITCIVDKVSLDNRWKEVYIDSFKKAIGKLHCASLTNFVGAGN